MKKFVLTTFFSAFVLACIGQSADFIVIKKKGQPYKTIFTGSFVQFQAAGGEWFDGRIIAIKNDTLFFKEVIVRQVGTPWGVTRLDTISTFTRKLFYKDIIALPRKAASFNYIKNGTLFMIIGAGYATLNLVNSSYGHYAPFAKDNRGNLIAAAGVFGLGKLLHSLRKPYLLVGKKYTLKYIKA